MVGVMWWIGGLRCTCICSLFLPVVYGTFIVYIHVGMSVCRYRCTYYRSEVGITSNPSAKQTAIIMLYIHTHHTYSSGPQKRSYLTSKLIGTGTLCNFCESDSLTHIQSNSLSKRGGVQDGTCQITTSPQLSPTTANRIS